MPEATLYKRLGGAPAVAAAVDVFYTRVMADPRIAPFFEGVDMARQAAKQKAFLGFVFGGPSRYTGADMRRGHAHLVARGLDDTHFDAVLENLAAAMRDLGVAETDIAAAAAIAETVRADVLGR